MTPECNATKKCWEHYQGWNLRVTTRTLDLAASLVTLQARAFTLEPNSRYSLNLSTACQLYFDLTRKQWREMTRPPFDFPSPSTSTPAKSSRPTLSDVLDML